MLEKLHLCYQTCLKTSSLDYTKKVHLITYSFLPFSPQDQQSKVICRLVIFSLFNKYSSLLSSLFPFKSITYLMSFITLIFQHLGPNMAISPQISVHLHHHNSVSPDLCLILLWTVLQILNVFKHWTTFTPFIPKGMTMSSNNTLYSSATKMFSFTIDGNQPCVFQFSCLPSDMEDRVQPSTSIILIKECNKLSFWNFCH